MIAITIIAALVISGLCPAFAPAIVMLACLALFAVAPVITIVLGIGWLLAAPLRFILVWFIGGLALGEGLKLSGVFRRRSPRWQPRRSRRWTRTAPRARGRRPSQYFPFDDNLPEDM